ncbi:MAG: hypothetical protein AAFP92_32545, partial [Bacteroidota bacterium]
IAFIQQAHHIVLVLEHLIGNENVAYMEQYNTTLYRSYNAVMKGYILITDEMLKDEDNVVRLLDESYDYVMSLDPK